jgi:hypothetical protein
MLFIYQFVGSIYDYQRGIDEWNYVHFWMLLAPLGAKDQLSW